MWTMAASRSTSKGWSKWARTHDARSSGVMDRLLRGFGDCAEGVSWLIHSRAPQPEQEAPWGENHRGLPADSRYGKLDADDQTTQGIATRESKTGGTDFINFEFANICSCPATHLSGWHLQPGRTNCLGLRTPCTGMSGEGSLASVADGAASSNPARAQGIEPG